MSQEFYSNGKLLITGEYAVLDGSLAFALPTKYGQSLKISPTSSGCLEWSSFDEQNKEWFKVKFNLQPFKIISSDNQKISHTLLKILKEASELNPSFLKGPSGYNVETKLTFPLDWGLGTSSTLINNIAQWAEIDPYVLLKNSFGGSGYDIACAQHNTPILFQLKNEVPNVHEVNFQTSFNDFIFFYIPE